MSDREHPDDDLVEALRRLPRDRTPPSRVAAALVASPAFANAAANPPAGRRRLAWRAAAAASLLIAAFAAGRATAPSPAPATTGGQEFALLLYGGPVGGGDAVAREYGAWAADLRRAGYRVTGERLADTAWIAGITTVDPLPLRGFFIVRAGDSADALDLARRHPHARDGTVVVRPIDTP